MADKVHIAGTSIIKSSLIWSCWISQYDISIDLSKYTPRYISCVNSFFVALQFVIIWPHVKKIDMIYDLILKKTANILERNRIIRMQLNGDWQLSNDASLDTYVICDVITLLLKKANDR